jgi:LytS/YehU family sensor histidine kinase
MVLEKSKSKHVTLANELETLRLYIEMEAMRFPGKLVYQISKYKMHATEFFPCFSRPGILSEAY